MKPILTLMVILFLFSCEKQEQQEREKFAFTGQITDCSTNAPIKNVRVDILLKDLSQVGLFQSKKEAGTTYTDENGHYNIKPIKYEGFSDIEINYSKEGYFSEISFIDYDSINKNGGDLFPLNQSMSEPGVIKLIFNNDKPYDSTDIIRALVTSSPRCDNTGHAYAELFTGNIVNRQIDRDINGNDTVHINYSVRKNGIFTKFETAHFCPARETTTVVINY
jgi:hypothetical protein